MDRRTRDQHRIDRAWQALAEWRGGELQRKVRDECLSLKWFRSRAEAKVIIETWRRRYNEVP
jgi:hypothetical protein